MVSETHVGTTVIDGVVAALEAAGVTASTLAASAVAAGRSTADHIDESVAALRTQLASAEAALGAGGDGSRSAALRAVAAQLLAQADEADAAANTEVEGGGTAAEMGASGKESAQPIASPRGDSPRVMAAAEPVMAAESVVAAEPVVDGEVSEEAADALMAAGKAVDAERLYRVLLARVRARSPAFYSHRLNSPFALTFDISHLGLVVLTLPHTSLTLAYLFLVLHSIKPPTALSTSTPSTRASTSPSAARFRRRIVRLARIGQKLPRLTWRLPTCARRSMGRMTRRSLSGERPRV